MRNDLHPSPLSPLADVLDLAGEAVAALGILTSTVLASPRSTRSALVADEGTLTDVDHWGDRAERSSQRGRRAGRAGG